MPTGLYDIRDRDEVLTPQEIEAGFAAAKAQGIDYIGLVPGQPVMPVARFKLILEARWKRAAQTGAMIDAMKQGYCSIEPATAPPRSDARH